MDSSNQSLSQGAVRLNTALPSLGTTPAKIKVMMIEDSRTFAETVGHYIREQPDLELLGMFHTMESARGAFSQLKPAVILLDIQLPDGSGLDLLPDIHRLLPDAEIVVLTTFDDATLVTAAVHLGVSGFLLKRSGLAEIVTAIRRVAAGGASLDEKVARTILAQFRKRDRATSMLPALTPQENKLLRSLADGKTLKEAASLAGITYETSRRYLQSAYRKLRVNSMTQAISLFLRNTP